MQDIVIRIRESIEARIKEMRQRDPLGEMEGLKSALAIIDQECFRREPAEANE